MSDSYYLIMLFWFKDHKKLKYENIFINTFEKMTRQDLKKPDLCLKINVIRNNMMLGKKGHKYVNILRLNINMNKD